ncbi:MAG TPA: hypothetical protein VHC69_07615 [Polyangiaceae bacterium]|nr:hypothetical protein [Polyangiaceae bacterium]
MIAVSGALALAYTLALFWFCHENGSLRGDDILYFADARRRPFLDFVAEQMDVHAVPLHRAATYLVPHLGRPDYGALLVVMVAVHALGVWLLYRALQAFAPNPGNAFATFWYASFVEMGVIFLWWTSALHRLPYVALSALSLYAYARFRREHSPAWAACVVASVIGALGFFEKGVITAMMLGAIEAALFFETDPRDRRKNWLLVGGLAIVCCVHFAIWRSAVGSSWSSVAVAPLLGTYMLASYHLLLSGTVGRVTEWRWPALALWTLLVAVTIRRAPRTSLLWVAGFFVVSASLLTTGLSVPRLQTWGMLLPYYSHRYYADVMFDVVVFFALVWQRAFPSGAWALRGRKSRWLSASSAIMAMTALALVSIKSSFKLMRETYGETRAAKRYIDNVVAGMERLKTAPHPPAFVDGSVPIYLNPIGGETARKSVLLYALGYHAKFYEPRVARRRRGLYSITDSGEIQSNRR